MSENSPIFVTRPALPPLDEFTEQLKKIWDSRIVTNNGPFHEEFEERLAQYLGVEHISLLSNGTLSLITALHVMSISGEVITSPFSFVATTHSLWWNNIKPVFADIEPGTFNLDPSKVEAAITERTTAIMPVHVYGNPCNQKELQRVADKYGLKLIYDAAHAFGVKVDGESLLNFGDLSILSFHATKVFNTVEGGAIVCRDRETKLRVDNLRNFGFTGEITVVETGINSKMNELQAAYGLLQLKYIDEYISKRRAVAYRYRELLSNKKGIRVLLDIEGVDHNYCYFPILIDSQLFGKSRDEVYELLQQHNIFGRRYFYPLISDFPPYRGLSSSGRENLPVASLVSEQVLCLPIYPDLPLESVEFICNLIE